MIGNFIFKMNKLEANTFFIINFFGTSLIQHIEPDSISWMIPNSRLL